MKNRIKFLLGSSLALPLITLSPMAVFAEDATTTTTTTTTNTTQTTKAPESKEQTATKKRIQERIDKMKLKLAAAEQLRIQARCSNAQGKSRSLEGRIKGIETSHKNVYGGTVTKLTALSEKLKAQGVDTAQLNTQIASLKTQVDKFNTDLAAYKQDVSDLSSMDCKADPTGFKAALESARAEQAALRQEAASIRAYIKNTIRPTLQVIRKQLDPKATDDADKTPATTKPAGGTQ